MTTIGKSGKTLIIALLVGVIALGVGLAVAHNDGTEIRITAMRHDDGRIEFAVQEREGEGWGERVLPRARFFPASGREGRWLNSTPITVGVVDELETATATPSPTATATPSATATPVPAATPMPTVTATPAPAQSASASRTYTIEDPHDRFQVNDITELQVKVGATTIAIRVTSGEFFSFSEQWTGDSSYVHLNFDFDNDPGEHGLYDDDLLVAVRGSTATFYDTTGDTFVRLGSSSVTQEDESGATCTVVCEVLSFEIPREHFGDATIAAVSVTGAWALSSPDCDSYGCSWYDYDWVPDVLEPHPVIALD